MKYRQLSNEERYRIGALRCERKGVREIARALGRSPSTISRELRRNRYPTDGRYRAHHAIGMTSGRRRRARQGSNFSEIDWQLVETLLELDWSPDQVSGHLRRTGALRISHETIYQHVWRDKASGGELWKHLRGARKQRRKRYGAYDSRGRLAGKRPIQERPAEVEDREVLGHWEIDTVHGAGKHSIVTIVERKSGYVEIGKIPAVTMQETTRSILELMSRRLHLYKTVTADNGSEFHDYRTVEAITDVPFYFATPHHSWERGTNENTNGLIRQYLPKGTSMTGLTQRDCDAIAAKLNSRPRKRLRYLTPNDVFLAKS